MKCPKGHTNTKYYPGDTYDEIYCQDCDRSYWYNQEFGLTDFDEADPCEEGYHEWKPIWEDGEEVGYECVRCGLIDI